LWCHPFVILVDWIIHLCFLAYKITWTNPWRFTLFFTGGVSSVTNFKYICSRFLCCVYSLISLSSRLVLRFLICGLVKVLFFESGS
jgi:hypothetical protein